MFGLRLLQRSYYHPTDTVVGGLLCITFLLFVLLWRQPVDFKPTGVLLPTAPAPAIASLHLFGTAHIPTSSLRATTLPLTLEGVIVNKNLGKSLALIKKGSGATKVYGSGQTIDAHTTIKSIDSTRVILLTDGQPSTLAIPSYSLSS